MSNFDKLDKKIKEEFRTEQDLEWFLTHNCLWSSALSLDDKIAAIKSLDCLKESLRELDYQEFLNSSYWDAVQEYLPRQMTFGCSLCGDERKKLKLYRKSTCYYGKELLPAATGDFLVLCPKCYYKMTKFFSEIKQNVEYCIEQIIRNYRSKK
jgi:hypothetical protein